MTRFRIYCVKSDRLGASPQTQVELGASPQTQAELGASPQTQAELGASPQTPRVFLQRKSLSREGGVEGYLDHVAEAALAVFTGQGLACLEVIGDSEHGKRARA